jgi:hypothetical protein
MSKKIIAVVVLTLFVPAIALASVTFNANTELTLNGTSATVWAMGNVTLGGGVNSEAGTVTLNAAASPELQVSAVPNNRAFHVGVGAAPTPATLFEVSPSGGTLNFSIDSSDILAKTGGYYLNQWKMTAAAAPTTISMKIQAEKANTTYWLRVDGVNDTTNTSDGSAVVSFSYPAPNTTERTFSLAEYTGGGGGGGGALPPAAITITQPNGGETIAGGGTYNVTWTATSVTTLDIYYSIDGGINFPYQVATGETNDGAYTWTVPNISTSTAKVKLVSGTVSDVSDANFAITYTPPTVSAANSTVSASPTSVVADGATQSTITVTVKNNAGAPMSGKTVTLNSSRGALDTITTVVGATGADGVASFRVKSSTAGTSTYTAQVDGVVISQTASVVFTAPGAPEVPPAEVPTGLNVGDLIKSSLSTTVYYYGSDNKRHIFPNEKTYFTWYSSWSGVKTIPASQLQGIALGKNVTVRPGTKLVKIETDPKVYAVEPGGLLRWVPTEARARTLYGDAWSARVIDIPIVSWGDYTFGADIATDKHPTGALIKYAGVADVYYIQGAEKKKIVTESAFNANRFQWANVLTAPATITYPTGTDITGAETALIRIY